MATNDENGVRLFLELASEPTEDIMVFGQAPCSAGRSKRRNVSYLGLLTPGQDGRSEITDLYKAKFGEPPPGTKVFIVTCQQKNGWKGFDHESSEIVPARPAGLQASSTVVNSSIPYMHKGCTRDAEGVCTLLTPDSQGGNKPETPAAEAATADIGDCGVADKPSGGPG